MRNDRNPSLFQISAQAIFCLVHIPAVRAELCQNIAGPAHRRQDPVFQILQDFFHLPPLCVDLAPPADPYRQSFFCSRFLHFLHPFQSVRGPGASEGAAVRSEENDFCSLFGLAPKHGKRHLHAACAIVNAGRDMRVGVDQILCCSSV